MSVSNYKHVRYNNTEELRALSNIFVRLNLNTGVCRTVIKNLKRGQEVLSLPRAT